MTGSDSLGNLHLSVTTILLQDFTSSESCVSDLKKNLTIWEESSTFMEIIL